MNERQTGVMLVRASRAGDVTTTELRLTGGQWPSPPVAPASVRRDAPENGVVVELHHLDDLSGPTAIFESYGMQDHLPAPGGPYSFFSWWSPDQFEVAVDTALHWELRPYEGSDHDHCRLTWKTLEPGDLAYSSEAGWVSPEAHEPFIRDDALRLRETRGHKARGG
ncbi:MAG TPA: hypothetical protein VKU89_07325 [Solirubrobacteraceae bacterium]|nr:hypothetical protein [Solirubrobacteraceae bacterium]